MWEGIYPVLIAEPLSTALKHMDSFFNPFMEHICYAISCVICYYGNYNVRMSALK